MYNLQLKYHFNSAHKLEDYNGQCRNLHGHTWSVLVEIKTSLLKNDMVIDFKKLKELINQYDHVTILQDRAENFPLITVMNDMNLALKLTSFNPTAENLCLQIKKMIDSELGITGTKVTLWESPETSITI